MKSIGTQVISKDENFTNEKNDCVVRALARRIKTSYTRAHEISEPFRRFGKRCNLTRSLLESVGLPLQTYGLSLGQFLKDHSKGCYLVLKRGHAFCIDQGKIFDDGRDIGKNSIITYYC